nr:ABC transporter ATP-binding protein [Gammaproteobacteria bacterium]NIT64608.1 ABC transporter ATP-binding protein [Gammaproteobacteria bacterium]NIV21581.1 ATP-binding cassette domain-containing protein [Gammaproteobacteria bacterium]NIY33188.1 ATP-binding cassette domain-containing protein [Gammaproteobacteria bacterium]
HLAVAPGEVLSVLGPSGCGKTTLLRLIAGFETPERGEVVQQGQVISRPGWVLPPERRHIGMVFQEYTLFPHLTVRENVQFGLQPALSDRVRGWLGGAAAPNGLAELRTSKAGLVELLALCGLTDLADRYPHELSGGQQQRVALGRALATRPSLLLLDEPFSSLDSTLRQRLREEVREVLKRSGATTILVTHDQEEAINMGDRVAVMHRGTLEQVGTPDEILQRPRTRFVAGFVGLNRFLPGRVEAGRVVTELGTFALNGDAPAHERVDVLLRPHQVTVGDDGPDGGVHGTGVRGTVRQVRFLGGQPLYTFALPSGREVLALVPAGSRLGTGDAAPLSLEPSPLVVFPAES